MVASSNHWSLLDNTCWPLRPHVGKQWVWSIACIESPKLYSPKQPFLLIPPKFCPSNFTIEDTKSFITLWYKKFRTLHHSVVQKVSSLAVLCSTKSIKPCITWWYKNFQTTSHSVIQIVWDLAWWYKKFYTTLAPASCELSFTLWSHGSTVHTLYMYVGWPENKMAPPINIFAFTWWYHHRRTSTYKYITLWSKKFQALLYSVVQKVSNLASLGDTKTFKPRVTQWYK